MVRSCILLLMLLQFSCDTKGHTQAVTESFSGQGWKTVQLDIIVEINPDQPPAILADLIVVLESGSSHGPTLVLNSIGKTAEFGEFDLEGHEVRVNKTSPRNEHGLYAELRRKVPYSRGDSMKVSIPVRLLNNGSLLHHWADDFVLASWMNVWYPAPIGPEEDASWSTMKAPGTMTYNIPGAWEVVSSGFESSSEVSEGRKQVMVPLDGSVARSFVAGPFSTSTYIMESGQSLDIVGTQNITRQQSRAEVFLHSIQVLEELFGPAPYPYHSIVEVPFDIPGFYGASEQNFILLKAQAFDDQLNSLPVLAHEAAHAWWAIAVGVELKGEGTLFMTEAMAQYSAILAIEQVHGEETAKEFMWSGAGGFSPNHDAEAFFAFAADNRDYPLITKRLGTTMQHYVADSKGAWVHHMLRKKMGDEAFFRALKKIVEEYSNETITIEEWRQAFNRETSLDLSRFFDQWLAWEGAPSLEVSFAEDRKGFTIQQIQSEGIYELDLEIALSYVDGSSETIQVTHERKAQSFVSPKALEIKELTIDPNRDLLVTTTYTN